MSGIFEGATQEQGAERARKRVAKLRDADLHAWMEVALPGLMRQWEEYTQSGEVAHLGEMLLADLTLSAVLAELYMRKQAQVQEDLSGS